LCTSDLSSGQTKVFSEVLSQGEVSTHLSRIN
jgi:hypothetical protein